MALLPIRYRPHWRVRSSAVSVPATLRDRLTAARRAGEPFEAAWTPAVRAAVSGEPARERRAWREALAATQTGWRAAYDRAPATRSDRAILMFAVDRDGEPLAEVTEEPVCGRCSDPIPSGRKRGARYCSTACQRAANGRIAA